MLDNTIPDAPADKRSESREILDRYYSVEFLLDDTGLVYQFKLRDVSSKGLCILVKEESEVLKHIKVSDLLDMQYNPPEALSKSKSLKTQIRHITKPEQETFKGHFFIGLSIIEKQSVVGK
jgi:hypothetical protein